MGEPLIILVKATSVFGTTQIQCEETSYVKYLLEESWELYWNFQVNICLLVNLLSEISS